MSAFKRYAIVAYDPRNFSILSVESVSSPELVIYNASNFQEIFSTLLTPKSNSISIHTLIANSMFFNLGRLLQSYQGYFGYDQQGPVDFLQHMLTISIQFSTVAWQLANLTTATEFRTDEPSLFPSDLETTASAVCITKRVIAAPWTIYTFISITS